MVVVQDKIICIAFITDGNYNMNTDAYENMTVNLELTGEAVYE